MNVDGDSDNYLKDYQKLNPVPRDDELSETQKVIHDIVTDVIDNILSARMRENHITTILAEENNTNQVVKKLVTENSSNDDHKEKNDKDWKSFNIQNNEEGIDNNLDYLENDENEISKSFVAKKKSNYEIVNNMEAVTERYIEDTIINPENINISQITPTRDDSVNYKIKNEYDDIAQFNVIDNGDVNVYTNDTIQDINETQYTTNNLLLEDEEQNIDIDQNASIIDPSVNDEIPIHLIRDPVASSETKHEINEILNEIMGSVNKKNSENVMVNIMDEESNINNKSPSRNSIILDYLGNSEIHDEDKSTKYITEIEYEEPKYEHISTYISLCITK